MHSRGIHVGALRPLVIVFAGLMFLLIVVIGGGVFFGGTKTGSLAAEAQAQLAGTAPASMDAGTPVDSGSVTPASLLRELAPGNSPGRNRPRFMGATKSGGDMIGEGIEPLLPSSEPPAAQQAQ